MTALGGSGGSGGSNSGQQAAPLSEPMSDGGGLGDHRGVGGCARCAAVGECGGWERVWGVGLVRAGGRGGVLLPGCGEKMRTGWAEERASVGGDEAQASSLHNGRRLLPSGKT
eukprot:37291-Chlamydomonas_euryale.AAC.1